MKLGESERAKFNFLNFCLLAVVLFYYFFFRCVWEGRVQL